MVSNKICTFVIMPAFPESLRYKLAKREEDFSLRELPVYVNRIDFSSNDYLGFAKSEAIFDSTHQVLIDRNIKLNGATGSRLLSGNHKLYQETEEYLAIFHRSETALIFNSGYDANVGFFSSVPQKSDVILYDELCHASIRDGIRLSNAKSFKFSHNDYEDLEKLLLRCKVESQIIYVATESVFSMDGDSPDLQRLISIVEKHKCHLVLDEAHALGVFGNKGEGRIQDLDLQDKVFARIVTFGKGLGCHGAAILGSARLKSYLINFARSFIYSTALSPHAVASILIAYQQLEEQSESLLKLRNNIDYFNREKQLAGLKPLFVRSKSAVQSAIIPGNEKVKAIASELQHRGFDVKPILSPTVPEGQERLRFCIHSYNSEEEIFNVLQALVNAVL